MKKMGKRSGKLKFFAPGEGKDFGFFISDGIDRDIWFHYSQISSGVADKSELIGQPSAEAEFDLYETSKGFEARDIHFTIEEACPYKGIRMWEIFDREGKEIIPTELGKSFYVETINLSRNKKLIFEIGDSGQQVVATIVEKDTPGNT